ncbi:MAG: response regulator [Planctomycetes bacterium]|nr:response regulator [Planctomycetota bacterium]
MLPPLLFAARIAALIACCLAPAFARARGEFQREPPLRIGLLHPLRVRGAVEWDREPPYEGYAPALIEAALRDSGREIEFVGLWDEDPIVALAEGRVDIAGPLPIFDAHLHTIDYSTPVLLVRGAAYSRRVAREVAEVEDLRGLRLGAAIAGIGQTWCAANALPCEAYQTLQETFEALLEGEIDYVITPQNAGRYELERLDLPDIVEHPLDSGSVWRHYAFAVRATDRALLSLLDSGIAVLRESGEFDEIYQAHMARWQPRSKPMSTSRRIVVWSLWIAVGGCLIAGAWQFVLRRELARRTRALRESEARHRAIFENSHDGILVVDPATFAVVEANERAAVLFGSTRACLIGPTLPALDRKALAEGTVHVVETLDAAGERSWIEISSSRARFDGVEQLLVLARDVGERIRAQDERSRLEAQLVHAQKLEGLGLLAGGIAHDFNNLMVGVMGNIDLALSHAEDRAIVATRLNDALCATERASELTHQLLAYSGRAKFSEELIDLGAVVTEMLQLLGTSLTDRAQPTLELDPALPLVRGDATLIRQVAMNLLTNARDALGPNGGRITVRTGVAECDLDYLRNELVPSDIAPGEYVYLEVEDTGCGMDEETLARIFDPFFSTKFTGRGLGLSVVLKTVQRHRGAVKVRSRPGLGTAFRLLIPPELEQQGHALVLDLAAPRANAGRMLLVDDDSLVRDVVKKMLAPHGWTWSEAADAPVALELLEGDARFDVVLLDVTMPGMSGLEALARIRVRWPTLPVVLMSGYSGEVAEDRGLEPDAFVHKPFTAATLLSAIQAALAVERRVSVVPS